ncbi:MAG TPA: response regulator transcription factor [Ignavibacteriaceae bacterium]|nr:response regulator transcription factor [Ignavibacteriaceae bacterium]
MIRVVVVEDNDAIREGLKMLIDGTEGYSCVAAFSECTAMLSKIKNAKPDVLLMDIGLPGMNGIEGIKRVRLILPDLAIMVLTVYEENDLVFDALCAGACGYLVKKTPPSKLLEAIKDAFEGGAPMSSHIARKVIDFFQKKKPAPVNKSNYELTPREKEILSGLVEGHNFKAIADSLFISIETVRFHFRNIYKKLHVHSQSEAVAKAIKEDLI